MAKRPNSVVSLPHTPCNLRILFLSFTLALPPQWLKSLQASCSLWCDPCSPMPGKKSPSGRWEVFLLGPMLFRWSGWHLSHTTCCGSIQRLEAGILPLSRKDSFTLSSVSVCDCLNCWTKITYLTATRLPAGLDRRLTFLLAFWSSLSKTNVCFASPLHIKTPSRSLETSVKQCCNRRRCFSPVPYQNRKAFQNRASEPHTVFSCLSTVHSGLT